MSTQDLIKKEQKSKFKEEIGLIKFRLFSSMSYLDLVDDERTIELYGKLDKALIEILKIEKEINA